MKPISGTGQPCFLPETLTSLGQILASVTDSIISCCGPDTFRRWDQAGINEGAVPTPGRIVRKNAVYPMVRRLKDGRYEPVSGQVDPDVSVSKLDGPADE